MDISIIFGFFLGFGLLLKAVGIEMGVSLFYEPNSLAIVLGGLLGATMIQFPFSQLIKVFPVIKILFLSSKKKYVEDIDLLVSLGNKSQKEGPLALSKEIGNINNYFLRNAIQLLTDRIQKEDLEQILIQDIESMNNRHNFGVLFFDQLAKYAPAFGLIGTLIGLIMMLSQLDDPASVGPSMSVALVTTLYGTILSNLVFSPISGRLRAHNQDEIHHKEMLLKGIMCIANNDSGFIIRENMRTFLRTKHRAKIENKRKKK